MLKHLLSPAVVLVAGSLASSVAVAGDKPAGKPANAATPAPAAAPAAAPAKLSVTAYADIKWQPIDPKNPAGIQVSSISGDMFKGPTAFYMKLPAGMKSGLHGHHNDYYGVVIAGAPAHGPSEKDPGKPLAIGSTWFQPGNDLHHDTCTGDKDCVILLYYPNGGFDYYPAPAAPAAPAAAPAKK
jgi:hypothetical protein